LTTIATSSTISISIAQLIAGGSSAPQTPAASSASDSSSATSSASSYGAAAFVTLSEQAKQAAATKLVTDQTAADQLQAYVAAHRANANNAGSAQSLFSEATPSTTGSQPQTATTGDKVQVIVAQIQTVADANAPQPFQTFTPTKSLSNSVTVDGYTLSVQTNASTQFYGTELSGNGTLIFDKHFGPSDEASGGIGAPDGVQVSSQIVDNNEALDAVTVTRNVASADSASISTPSGSASTSSVNAQSSSITFLVNYATGAISVQQSALSVSAQSSSVSPGSTLSTLA
jgi:ATPase subunit of ABC transporter with duplicated ATPase domains